MKVIDMHLHLDETIRGESKVALDILSREMIKEEKLIPILVELFPFRLWVVLTT